MGIPGGSPEKSYLILNVAEAMLMVTMIKHHVWVPGPDATQATSAAPPALPWSCSQVGLAQTPPLCSGRSLRVLRP